MPCVSLFLRGELSVYAEAAKKTPPRLLESGSLGRASVLLFHPRRVAGVRVGMTGPPAQYGGGNEKAGISRSKNRKRVALVNPLTDRRYYAIVVLDGVPAIVPGRFGSWQATVAGSIAGDGEAGPKVFRPMKEVPRCMVFGVAFRPPPSCSAGGGSSTPVAAVRRCAALYT